jgi:DNA-binding GntR family transcriptional regulator
MRKTIILGEVPTGIRINEKELSRKMNISRTPVRYALTQLERDRLVFHTPGKGFVTEGISINDANEIYAIRGALDSLASTTAMHKMTDSDFTAMRKLLETTEAMNEINDVEGMLHEFSEFNLMIYNFADMPRLKSISYRLREYLIYFRDISIRNKNRGSIALLEHRIIYDNMRLGDEAGLQSITKRHLESSLKFVVEQMKNRKNIQ